MVCVICTCLCVQPEIANIEKLIADRAATIRAKKEEMNCIEDEIFAKFCREIGVANIRWVWLIKTAQLMLVTILLEKLRSLWVILTLVSDFLLYVYTVSTRSVSFSFRKNERRSALNLKTRSWGCKISWTMKSRARQKVRLIYSNCGRLKAL